MTIRAARDADAGAIRAITNDLIRNTAITFTTQECSEAGIKARIAAADGAFLVAERAGAVVGFARLGAFRSGPGYAHTAEHSVQLAPGARGAGLGRALMTRLAELARARGVHVLVAAVSGANPGGIAFHAALGFTRVGVMPQVGCKGGQWLDLVLMQKILGDGEAGGGAGPATGPETGPATGPESGPDFAAGPG